MSRPPPSPPPDARPDLPADLADATATALLPAYRAGTVSPVEVVAAVTARIAACEPHLHALYAPDLEHAASRARDSERRWAAGDPVGALDGVPITIKENIPTRGTPVPGGTAATDRTPAAVDGPPAARVREAGAVLLAKTTMPDWGMSSSGLSSFHDLARNPWNLDWNPGGSSAGAAAAAAAGYGPLHVGSDIGGSVRLPAGWTATVALKPSWGRVPVDPPYWGRVVGPMARTVADAALLLNTLARPDPADRDHLSLPATDVDHTELEPSVTGLRVGLHLDAGAGLDVDPDVLALVAGVADAMAAAGARVEPLAPFFDDEQLALLDLFWRARGWADYRALSPAARERVLPYTAAWVRGGADVDGETLIHATQQQLAVGARTVAATRAFDLVVSPVSPVPTFPATWPGPTNDVDTAMHHIAFTVPYNFSHQPAIAVHAGFTRDGRPVGVQLAGRRFDDHRVLSAAAWWERHRPADADPDWPTPVVRDLVAAAAPTPD